MRSQLRSENDKGIKFVSDGCCDLCKQIDSRVDSSQKRAYSTRQHLILSIFLKGTLHPMMAFSAFFDASGNESKQEPLAVAGYIASREQWLLFERDWNETLKKAGLRYFHMTEFINRSGQFKGWERTKRSHLFDSLTTLIEVRVRKAFGCIVLCDALDLVNRKYFLTERLGHAFPMSAMTVLGRVFVWSAQIGHRQPILSVFEDGDRHKGELQKLAKRYLPEELRPIFQSKRLAPLQAADIAAWDLRNVVAKIQELAKIDIWEKSYKRLHRIPNDYQSRGEKELVGLCHDLKIPLRSAAPV